jgi:tetratricopeptide (TPR) repeat protein
MQLVGKRVKFRKEKRRSNLYRMMLWFSLVVAGVLIYRGVENEQIKPLFLPTPTPTRTYNSYKAEGDTYFNLGKLDCHEGKQDCAIEAYRNATRLEPDNALLWTDLARIQAYSSVLLTTEEQQLQRKKEALESINRAIELEPEDSTVVATRAFVLDWYASSQLLGQEEVENTLYEAENEATRAIYLDEGNTNALAYYAEILLDQKKWLQAQQYIERAREKDDSSMDVNRVSGQISESMGDYLVAIDYFKKASDKAPNLTYLYIRIGHLYRHLGNVAQAQRQTDQGLVFINEALDYYGKAATLNGQLDIKDPTPYLAIANTYTQQGEFFIAVLNVRKALELNPSDPKVFAQLGWVYRSSKNYEGAIEAFKCALEGCTAEEACRVRENTDTCKQDSLMLPLDRPLSLTFNNVHFYYSYGSILAALHKPSRPYCDDAVRIFSQIRGKFSDEPEIISIVSAGEELCAAAGIRANP